MSLMDAGFGDMLTPGMESCTMMDRTTAETALGLIDQYAPGAGFMAYLRKDTSPEIRVAERQGIAEQYTVIVPKSVTLRREDVFRRDASGETYKCTSNTRDGEAPDMASLQIAKCTAERWDIP